MNKVELFSKCVTVSVSTETTPSTDIFLLFFAVFMMFLAVSDSGET